MQTEKVEFDGRNLEPYRGYHIFMRALPDILRRRPNAVVLVVGGNGVSYGAAPPPGTTWAAKFLAEVQNDIDPARVFFPGKLSYAAYLRVLQVSACHVYLTYPFVLSWSCLEAMSAGCLVIGSATPPVQEVIEDGRNGVLTDFFDRQALVDRIDACLSDPDSFASMRQQARETIVERYDLRRICLPRQIALVEAVAGDKG